METCSVLKHRVATKGTGIDVSVGAYGQGTRQGAVVIMLGHTAVHDLTVNKARCFAAADVDDKR